MGIHKMNFNIFMIASALALPVQEGITLETKQNEILTFTKSNQGMGYIVPKSLVQPGSTSVFTEMKNGMLASINETYTLYFNVSASPVDIHLNDVPVNAFSCGEDGYAYAMAKEAYEGCELKELFAKKVIVN